MGLAGKCLDANGGNSADGTRVQLWTCNGTAAQDWNHRQPPAGGSLRGHERLLRRLHVVDSRERVLAGAVGLVALAVAAYVAWRER